MKQMNLLLHLQKFQAFKHENVSFFTIVCDILVIKLDAWNAVREVFLSTHSIMTNIKLKKKFF